MSTVIEALSQYPEVAIVVALVMRAGLAWQRQLSWYEYRTLHGLKRLAFPVLDRVEPFGFGVFVNEKGDRGDREYHATLQGSVRSVVRQLREGGGSLHLISSVKRRPSGRGDTLSRAHVVWTHDDGTQTECYLFQNDDGTTDVYVHHETGVADPAGHLSDRQRDGDVRGVVADALGE